MRFMTKAAIAVGVSVLLFFLTQVLFGNTSCFDCGLKVGFPFPYKQEGTYGTHGHFIWLGFVGVGISFGITTLVVWVLSRKEKSK